MQKQPPQYALRFLRWFCREDYLEEIEGDLVELFEAQYEHEPRRARRRLFWQVMRYFRPDFLKVFDFDNPLAYSGMIKHNLLISYRSFLRNKSSFLINLTGLSTGLACVLLIYLWVQDERSIDKFHAKDSQLYQVMHNIPRSDGIMTIGNTPGLLGMTLGEQFPEVEFATSVVPASWFFWKGIISTEEKSFKAPAQYIGKNYFKIFSCDFTVGSPDQLLSKKQGVAISEKLALKLFNSTEEEVIGKSLQWDMRNLGGHFEVAGIFASPPANATEQFDLLFNYELFLESRPFLEDWGNSDPSTFLILREGTNLQTFNKKITRLLRSKNEGTDHSLFATKYSDKYLYGHYENGQQAGGRIEYIRLFSIIALFILIIACVNFMNLSTAKASLKAKEIGVKKALGASRSSLVVQHLSEAILLSIISVILAISMVAFSLTAFNQITNKAITLEWDFPVITAIGLITLCTGLIAGSYPAFYLSGFRPVDIFRGGKSFGKSGAGISEKWIRKGLVIMQFSLSTILIVSVWIVHQQIAFVQQKNLGYEHSGRLHFGIHPEQQKDKSYFETGGIWQQKVESMLSEINGNPDILSACNYSHDLFGFHGGFSGMDWEEGEQDRKLQFSSLEVGYDFAKTMGLEMDEGRFFSREYGDNEFKLIINEEARKLMGLADPIGKQVRLWHEDREIIGVVKNFHFESLHEPIKPCIMQIRPGGRNIMVKIREGKAKEALTYLEEVYEEHYAGFPFEYQFLDEDFQKMYEAEHRITSLSSYFAGLSILISCLGLLGLTAFMAESRTREIGIRKVLGAGRWNIVKLLSSDFTKTILLAILISLPIGFLLTDKWLNTFAYKMELSWMYFAGTALFTLMLTWITVGFQTYKKASLNPVECLRDE